MANDTVWIIVPVYNVEKYLKKCVESIRKQTYKNWKAVLVDDGSTDRSGKMCDEFASTDDRINVIHTENCGLPGARRNGIRQIPDDCYCTFVDSDDWIPYNALELLINEIKKDKSDVVCGKMDRKIFGFSFPKQNYHTCFSDPGFYDHNKMMKKLFVSCFGSFDYPVSLWGKVFNSTKLKRVMLEDVQTPVFYAEDLDVNLRLMPLLDSVSILDAKVYCYRAGGGTGRFMQKFLSDSLFMYNRKKEYTQYYPDKERALRMTANEIVSFSMSHLIMCERYKRYPQGSLVDEAKYICSLPEIQDALSLLGEDDSGHFIGTGKAFVNGDYQALAEFAHNKAEERKWKDRIIRILFR